MRWLSIYFLFTIVLTLSSAEIIVHDSFIEEVYHEGDVLLGTVNVTITNEPANVEVTASQGTTTTLLALLEDSFIQPSCSTPLCSLVYDFSEGTTSKSFILTEEELTHGGFVIEGENVIIQDVFFNVTSDFASNDVMPLEIEFIEGYTWNFDTFEEESYSSKSWGCYNPLEGKPGPFIKQSEYCEVIPIPFSTPALFVGSAVSTEKELDTTKHLEMILRDDDGNLIDACDYNPFSEEGCEITAGEGAVFDAKPHQVCVAAPSSTDYLLFTETTGALCGFVSPSTSFSSDYGIFLQTAQFADASKLDASTIDFEEITSRADEFIEQVYGRDCTDSCVLPFSLQGIPQNISFFSVAIEYSSQGDWIEDKVYDVTTEFPLLSYAGEIDLFYGSFEVDTSELFTLFFGSKLILEEAYTLISSPTILSLSPLFFPAGIPVVFTAITSYSGISTETSSYLWNFGDGTSEQTTTNTATHTFNSTGTYFITVETTIDGLTGSNIFEVTAQDPFEAVNETLITSEEKLTTVIKEINELPLWYQEFVRDTIGLPDYETQMDSYLITLSSSPNGSALIDFAAEVFSTDFLEELEHLEYASLSPNILPTSIYPEAIALVEGFAITSPSSYAAHILEWQETNTLVSASSEVLAIGYSSGTTEPLMTLYTLDIMPLSQEISYLVITAPFTSLTFATPSQVTAAESYSVIPLNPQQQNRIEFFSTAEEDIGFFVSPSLQNLVIGIDTTCNYNSICEKEKGETYTTCRNDCKPFTLMWLYLGGILVFALLLYTLLQWWYSTRYETHLFGDSRALFNLLMFITNARANRKTEKEISRSLTTVGWSQERIDYALKKSLGKNPGLPEIIPFSKISAWKRNKQVKKNSNNETTRPPPAFSHYPPRKNNYGRNTQPDFKGIGI